MVSRELKRGIIDAAYQEATLLLWLTVNVTVRGVMRVLSAVGSRMAQRTEYILKRLAALARYPSAFLKVQI
jgi:hypothetical protein